jgi:hypothetical protein
MTVPPALLEGVAPGLKKLVDDCHGEGLKIIPYFLYPAIS